MSGSSLPDRVPWGAEDYAGNQITHLHRKDTGHFWTIKAIGRHGIKFNAFDIFHSFEEVAEKFTLPGEIFRKNDYLTADLYK